MFCEKCGNQLPENTEKFCPVCGTPIHSQADTGKTDNDKIQDIKHKLISLAKNKKIIISAVIVVIAIIVIAAFSNERNVAKTMRENVVFEKFGSKTIGDAAERNLEDITWDSEKINNKDYIVTLEGFSDEFDEDIMLTFDVTLEDGDIYATVDSVEIDGEEYDDWETIYTVLGVVYGMSVEEANLYYWANIWAALS